MMKINKIYIVLTSFIICSFLIKIVLIIKYKNLLTLDSDDLNYIKSAVVLVKKGFFVFHNYNEPTVFITPLYPLFLASIFKIFGYGMLGFQAVRIVQAVLSSITVLLIFLTARKLFNDKIGLVAAFLVSFYLPNIVTVGYMLTETLFTTLLCLLIYLSIIFVEVPSKIKFFILGAIWGIAVLCRPTVALFPILMFIYILIHNKYKIITVIKFGVIMGLSFSMILAPWWIRNYQDYKQFIPLAASSGNPMLQGTYLEYKQTPQTISYYKLGKNAFETDKSEVNLAKKRITNGFGEDFWGYLRWYTIGKTYFLWMTIFYWKQYFGITPYQVYLFHCIILLGFIGGIIALYRKFATYFLPISVIVYFNIVHCITMAFDRYAFPLLPILSIFSAYLIVNTFTFLQKSMSIRPN